MVTAPGATTTAILRPPLATDRRSASRDCDRRAVNTHVSASQISTAGVWVSERVGRVLDVAT
jgi:hypothetical protein